MKNQTRQAWSWQGLIATAFLMTVGVNNAFADASNCANPSELTLDPDGQVTMRFCEIPAAQGVLIGSENVGSENGWSNETPVMERNFQEFQRAQFEVTQLQYKTVTGSEPWKENGEVKSFVQEGDDNPAVYVSYYDAVAFADRLSEMDETATYRLPTEAEWEYAARAGTTTEYYWGDEMDSDFAYFWGNTETTGQYARKVDSCPNPSRNESSPGYCANDFGLYHMLGNVWEWTADAYEDSYDNAPTDGNLAVAGPSGSARVMRGGGWNFGARYVRSAVRLYWGPAGRYDVVGFRLVRIAK